MNIVKKIITRQQKIFEIMDVTGVPYSVASLLSDKDIIEAYEIARKLCHAKMLAKNVFWKHCLDRLGPNMTLSNLLKKVNISLSEFNLAETKTFFTLRKFLLPN